mgnify:CR=1 FL=1
MNVGLNVSLNMGLNMGLTVGLNVNQNVGLKVDLTGDAEASKEMLQKKGSCHTCDLPSLAGQFPFSPVFVTGKTRIID